MGLSAVHSNLKRGAQRSHLAKMMKFTALLVVLFAVASVHSKKYIGGCVGTLGGCDLGPAVPAGPGAGGYAVGRAAPGSLSLAGYALSSGPVVHLAPPAAENTRCFDTFSGCAGYVGLGYCGQSYYATGCCASCGLYKKKK